MDLPTQDGLVQMIGEFPVVAKRVNTDQDQPELSQRTMQEFFDRFDRNIAAYGWDLYGDRFSLEEQAVRKVIGVHCDDAEFLIDFEEHDSLVIPVVRDAVSTTAIGIYFLPDSTRRILMQRSSAKSRAMYVEWGRSGADSYDFERKLFWGLG